MFLRSVRRMGVVSCVLIILAGCGSDEDDPLSGYSPDADTIELIQQLNDSMGNLHVLNRAIRAYRDKHAAWPDNLEVVKDLVDSPGYAEVMKNPVTGDDPGYVYTKPADGADPSTTIIICQLRDGKPDLSLDVLYADGNVAEGPDAIVEPLTKQIE